ncbi:MAG: flippase [Candidatus Liptonbacteria bacterium]|nr:flippase [Candidatus Liptonbacteria bacterium]
MGFIKKITKNKFSFGVGVKNFLFKNLTTRQTFAKNVFWLAFSNIGGRLIRAAIIVYAARVLGAAGWGVFSYAMTLAGFLTLFIDPGLNTILIRDVAKSSEEDQKKILSTTFLMKTVLLIAAVFLILFVAPFFSTLPGASVLLPLVALIITFDTIRGFFSAFIWAKENMEQEASISILTNVAIVIFSFIFFSFKPSIASFAWGYVAGTAVGAVAATFVLRRYIKKIFSFFSVKLIKPIIVSAWPFAITGTLGLLLTNMDILIISWMRTASDVGIYSAAIRIVQILYALPVIIQLSALPLFSRLARRDNQKFRAGFERTVGFVFLASVPLALGGALLGTQIMTFVFGAAYAGGGLAFKILALTILVDYPMVIISAAVFAYSRQKGLIIAALIGGISNVVLDLILIPRFGITGSAVATLIAQTLSNWYLWHMMKKINYFEVMPKLKIVITAGVIMASVTALLLALHINVILNIALSAAVYFGVLVVFREPLLMEIKRILRPTAQNTPEPSSV